MGYPQILSKKKKEKLKPLQKLKVMEKKIEGGHVLNCFSSSTKSD